MGCFSSTPKVADDNDIEEEENIEIEEAKSPAGTTWERLNAEETDFRNNMIDEIWRNADTNNDGVLSFKEIQSCLASLFEENPIYRYWLQVAEDAAKRTSKAITKKQYFRFMGVRDLEDMIKGTDSDLDAVFDKADTDHNMVLSLGEIKDELNKHSIVNEQNGLHMLLEIAEAELQKTGKSGLGRQDLEDCIKSAISAEMNRIFGDY